MLTFLALNLRKQVDFGEGKVLLSKIGNDIHATSAFCTHYGAPLASEFSMRTALQSECVALPAFMAYSRGSSGVIWSRHLVGHPICRQSRYLILTIDASPWHGACFNVCTGDIEDAPAPAAIHKFEASVKEGTIYVTADPSKTTSANKSRAPSKVRLPASATPPSEGVVIVGGGAGGLATLIGLRESGYEGAVTILSAETHAPIDRTKLSKTLLTDLSKLEWYPKSEIKENFAADLHTGVHVTSIDTGKKSVSLDGATNIFYDKLVLASGATPRRLSIPGANLPHVYTLRGVEDAKRIDAALGQGNAVGQTLGLGKRLVVIGSSFIGMELVVATTSRKLKEVHVIGIEKYPLQTILGEKIGDALRKVH